MVNINLPIISGTLSFDFFFLMVIDHIFLLLHLLIIFDWWTLMSNWIYYLFLQSLGFSSGRWLIYWYIYLFSFQGFFPKLCQAKSRLVLTLMWKYFSPKLCLFQGLSWMLRIGSKVSQIWVVGTPTSSALCGLGNLHSAHSSPVAVFPKPVEFCPTHVHLGVWSKT